MSSVSGPRIAYVTDQRLPNTVATSEQAVNMAAALAAGGAQVDLLIPRRLHASAIPALRTELAAYYGVGELFELVCLPEPFLAPRTVRKAAHGFQAAVRARRRPYDLLYTRTVLPALIGAAIGRPVVLETYQVLDQQRPLTARLVAALSRSPALVGVVAHSDLARDGLLRAGAAPDRVAVFRNGFNPRRLRPVLSIAEARRRLGWDQNARIVGYTGRVDVDKGALAILETAARTPEITYVAVGDSERVPQDWLVREAARRGCDNVRWVPAVPPSELGPYLYAADVLLVPPTAGPLDTHGRTVLPLKTYFYMAAGRPILAPALPDIEEVLTTDTAALVPADAPDETAIAVRRLFAEPERAAALARRAQRAVADFTWEQRAARILSWIAERREA
jgi:glycosyltransferase involved in cell wall biosynthesis